jgi:hypothetical protein
MIRFWCQCGRQMKANGRAAGEIVKCSLCRRLHVVPEHDLPRTADFPPVPPRGSVNASGEITRRTPGPLSPVAGAAEQSQEAPVRLPRGGVLGLILACAACAAAYLLLRGLAIWAFH